MTNFFDPEEFLEVAKELKKIDTFPILGKLRTSVSRAYYAAFLKAKIKLESLGYSFPNNSQIHLDVRDCLNYKLKKSDIASPLLELFNHRVNADYEIKKRISPQICDRCIKLSEEIINLIDNL